METSTDAGRTVLVDVAGRVATITLHRPEARNAINRRLMYELWDAVLDAGSDDDVDVLILTGADPAFCAGVDLKEAAGEVHPSTPERRGADGPGRGPDGLFRFLPEIDKPIVGAVNGVCVTGGLEIALQCTFLIASERARFADTHGRVGVMPGGGMTVLGMQAMGLRRAIEMSLTGNFFDADEALRIGLVNHVVAHDDLLPTAGRLAADIADNDRDVVRLLLGHYRRIAAAGDLATAHRIEGDLAEGWAPGVSRVGETRADVAARAHDQLRP